ncbi:MAG: type II secretion system GspH family protein [Acidobacteria bacterium]|nr:type II secretion system GspH family protein [Acidobacteriota bacterium]
MGRTSIDEDRTIRTGGRLERGFTFMELLIVMVIIAILSTVAIPVLVQHIRRAKEVVLQQNLWAMRHAIDQYTTDKEKPPSNLQDLVSAGYLREIPKDPVCSECTWSEIPTQNADDLNSGGLGDVKSTAQGSDSSGKPFTEY